MEALTASSLSILSQIKSESDSNVKETNLRCFAKNIVGSSCLPYLIRLATVLIYLTHGFW